MSDETRRELEFIDEALDDVEATPEQIAETVSRLPVSPTIWAAEVRDRAAVAKDAARHGQAETGASERV